MQALDAFHQLFDLISRKIGDVKEVSSLAEELFKVINQQTEALRESLPAFTELKNGAEKKFRCQLCNIPLTGLEAVLNHKHPELEEEWIVPVAA